MPSRRLAARAPLVCALLILCCSRFVAARDHGGDGGDGDDESGHGRGCGKPDPAFQMAMQQMLSATASGGAAAAAATSSAQLNGGTAASSAQTSTSWAAQLQGGQLACALAVSSQAASAAATSAFSLQSPLRLSAATCHACGAAAYCPVGVDADGTMAARPSAFFACAPGGDVAAAATSGSDAMQYCALVPSRLTVGLATALPLAAAIAAVLCCCRYCRFCPWAKRAAAARAADLEAAQRAVAPPTYINALHGKAMQGGAAEAAAFFVGHSQDTKLPAYGAPPRVAAGVPVYYPEVPVYAAELQRR